MLARDRHRRQQRMGNYRLPDSRLRFTPAPRIVQKDGTISFGRVTTRPDPIDPGAATLPISQSDVTGLTASLAGKQPLDSDLTTLAANITAAGHALVDDANAAAQLTTLGVSAFAQTILDDANAAAVRTTIGAGTSSVSLPIAESDVTGLVSDLAAKQPLDATLTALAGLATGADKLAYSSGTDTFAQTDLTAAARTVLDDATVAAMVDTLGGASSTGTGGLVRASGGTLVAPLLGTPASGVLTNMTGLDAWRGTVYTTADLALTNALADLTPASGPSLAFAVVASGVYRFHFRIIADADATTTGIVVSINGPASPTVINYQQWIYNASGTFGGMTFATAYDSNPAVGNSAGTEKRYYEVVGHLVNGANAGNVIARVRRENVGSGTARAYSFVDWQRLA